MMSYLHTKFHDNWISSFRGVAMTRFWDGRTDRRTDGRSDCTPRPAFAFGDAGKNVMQLFCLELHAYTDEFHLLNMGWYLTVPSPPWPPWQTPGAGFSKVLIVLPGVNSVLTNHFVNCFLKPTSEYGVKSKITLAPALKSWTVTKLLLVWKFNQQHKLKID